MPNSEALLEASTKSANLGSQARPARPGLARRKWLFGNHWRTILVLYYAILILPLFVASIARPLSLWDYLTGPDVLSENDTWLNTGSLVRNYVFNTVHNDFILRPTIGVLYQLLYIACRGEFWVIYVLKWAAKLVAVLLVWSILSRLGTDELSRWAVASLLLFHPCSFELMLFSVDGWAALGILGLLALLQFQFKNLGEWDVKAIPWWRLAVLFAVWYLVLGIKETCIIPAALILFAIQRDSGWSWRAIVRLLAFYLLLVFWAGRLYMIWKARFSEDATVDLEENICSHFSLMIPPFSFHLLGIFLGIALVLSILYMVRTTDGSSRRIGMICIGSAVGILLMSSTAAAPAARYVIPSVYLAAIPIGLGIARMKPRGLKIFFLGAFPPLMAGNIYAQALAYQQQFYEISDEFNAIQRKAEDGFVVAVKGRDEPRAGIEEQQTIARFFELYGPEWYRTKRVEVYAIARETAPKPFVLMTTHSPSQIQEGAIAGVGLEQVGSIEQIQRSQYGCLGFLAQCFGGVDSILAPNSTPAYDLGAPWVGTDSKYYLYSFPAAADTHGQLTFDVQAGDPSGPMAIRGHEKYTITAAADQELLAKAPIPAPDLFVEQVYAGMIKLEEGGVTFGITNAKGEDINYVPLYPSGSWRALPVLPPLNAPPAELLYLFFYKPKGSPCKLMLRDLQHAGVHLLAPNRRFGSITR